MTFFKKKIPKGQAQELLEISRWANQYRYTAAIVKDNSALVPKGQEVAKQYEALAELLENVKKTLVSKILTEMGYPKGVEVNVNLKTRIIED